MYTRYLPRHRTSRGSLLAAACGPGSGPLFELRRVDGHGVAYIRPMAAAAEDLRVAIIGAGIGGLALGLALRERGVAAEVFEQAPALAERSEERRVGEVG